jgi:UDP-MurNAc hydroxylase
MKITHFSNSFISVSAQGECLVCDPWMGKANSGGWQSFPEFSLDALAEHLKDARWIYLSHLHDDHFNIDTLTSCGLLNREFIIKRFAAPIFRERLKRLGITRIHEIDPFTVQRFGPFDLSIFPQMTSNSSALRDDVNYDLDTSIAIRADGVVFFNQVDNPLSLVDLVHINEYIVEHLGPIDIASIMSGAASEYPHLFLGIDQKSEKLRIVKHALEDLGSWLDLLRPRYFFPAGGTYLIPGWMSIYNDNVAQPTFAEIELFIKLNGLSALPLALEGGGYLEMSAAKSEVRVGLDLPCVETNRECAIEMHRRDRYLYETLDSPSWPNLIMMLDAARDNWIRIVTKSNFKIHQSIRFEIYTQLVLRDEVPDPSFRAGSYQIFEAVDEQAGELIIHIDQRAILGCVTRRLIWNGVLGSLCLYERRPNRHYPTDFFSLNFVILTRDQITTFCS